MMNRFFGPVSVLAFLVLVSPAQSQEASTNTIERLTQEAEAEPGNSDVQVRLGFALMRERRFDEARRVFEKALALAPNYHDARMGLARIAFFQGKFDAAEKELKELRERAPDNAEAKELAEQVERARAAQARRGPAEAERLARQGTNDYRAGRIARAVRTLSRAAALDPDNSDIQVQLGSALLAQGRFADARSAFRKALRLAPNYHDARVGLARVAIAQGSFGEADRELKALFERSPNHAEGKAVRAQLARVRAAKAQEARAEADRRERAEAEAVPATQRLSVADAEARPRWRFDLVGSYSHLSDGNEPWREGTSRLAYRFDSGTTLSAGVEVSRRFGEIDTLIDGRVDQQWSDASTTYLRIGGTPKADFRPQVLVETGGTLRLMNASGVIGPTLAMIDLGYANYEASDVGTIAPGVQQYFLNNRLWLTVRFIGTLSQTSDVQGENGTERSGGYSVRADAQVTDRLSLFVGYANAPDTSDGRLFDTQSFFGGATFALDDSISLLVSAAKENRKDSYDRTSVNLGVAVRF
ncbi:MAG TPA: tetratricopeptide repeat protein [Microvirga sp.]|nr:tetratricopeptide repeat protein [Microvirga sp.]